MMGKIGAESALNENATRRSSAWKRLMSVAVSIVLIVSLMPLPGYSGESYAEDEPDAAYDAPAQAGQSFDSEGSADSSASGDEFDRTPDGGSGNASGVGSNNVAGGASDSTAYAEPGSAVGGVPDNALAAGSAPLNVMETDVAEGSVASVTKEGGNPVGYATLADALNAARDSAAGGWRTTSVTVDILQDITFDAGTSWTSVVYDKLNPITINGHNHSITGLPDSLYAKSGSGTSTLTINDLSFIRPSDTTPIVSGAYSFAGIIMPYADSVEGLFFNHVSIEQAQVKIETNTGSTYAAAFIGYSAGYSNQSDGPVYQRIEFNNCSVTNSSIEAPGSVGALMGHANGSTDARVVVAGTKASGNVITCTGSSTEKAGVLFGTVGALGPSGNHSDAGLFVSASTSNNTVKSGNAVITSIYGRQGSSTGVLTLTEGGSYDASPIAEADSGKSWVKYAEGFKLTKNDDGTYTTRRFRAVAKIGETGYESLQEAVDVAFESMSGEVTVALVEDIEGSTVIRQQSADKVTANNGALKLTIDGGGHTITGQIILDGSCNGDGEDALAITRIGFKGGLGTFALSNAFICNPRSSALPEPYRSDCEYNNVHNVTVSSCSFTRTSSDDSVVGFLTAGGASNLVMDSVTCTGLHSLAQLYGTKGATFKNCKTENSDNGVDLNGCEGTLVFTGNTVSSSSDSGYGIRLGGDSACTLTLDNTNKIAARGDALLLATTTDRDNVISVGGGTYTGKITKSSTQAKAKFAISGGDFSEPVYPDFCAEGKAPTGRRDNGTYTVANRINTVKLSYIEDNQNKELKATYANNGTAANTALPEYTGESHRPTVSDVHVYDTGNPSADGILITSGYIVRYKDSTGKEVAAFTEPGTYTVEVEATGENAGVITAVFEVQSDKTWKLTAPFTPSATIENNTATFRTFELNWLEKNANVGRSEDGYWVGVLFTAPPAITASNVAAAQYRIGSGAWQSFDQAKHSGNVYPAYMQAWIPITQEQIEQAIKQNSGMLTWTYAFTWDGDASHAQAFTIQVDPNDVTFVKGGVPQFKTVGNKLFYPVTFDADGGTLAAGTANPLLVENGRTATKPEDPTKEGKAFAGWSRKHNDQWIGWGFSSELVNGPLTLKAQWDNAVAQIGAKGYARLADAIADAPANAGGSTTIQLLSNTVEAVTVPAGKNVTLDLNGKTLESAGAGAAITVASGATLTVVDTSADRTGYVKSASGASDIAGNGAVVVNAGRFSKPVPSAWWGSGRALSSELGAADERYYAVLETIKVDFRAPKAGSKWASGPTTDADDPNVMAATASYAAAELKNLDIVVTGQDGAVLSEGKDYSVSYLAGRDYANVTASGAKPTVTVEANGTMYAGSFVLEYTIVPATIDSITLAKNRAEYTGSDMRNAVTGVGNVAVGSSAGVVASDKYSLVITRGDSPVSTMKDVGVYTISVVSKDANYTVRSGGVSAAFTVAERIETGNASSATSSSPSSSPSVPSSSPSRSSSSSSFASVTLGKTSYTYDGYAKKPEVTVAASNGAKLVEGTDYTVHYYDNVNAGGAYAIVLGTGAYNGYYMRANFTIKPAKILSIAKILPQTYKKGKKVRPRLDVRSRGITLTSGVDYTAKYKKNRNVGKAKVTVKGRGNYVGAKSRTFTIIPRKTRIRSLVSEEEGQIVVRYAKRLMQEQGYQIAYGTSKKVKSAKRVVVGSKRVGEKTIANLDSGKTYYVRVRTFTKVGSKRYYSRWSGMKSVVVFPEDAEGESDDGQSDGGQGNRQSSSDAGQGSGGSVGAGEDAASTTDGEAQQPSLSESPETPKTVPTVFSRVREELLSARLNSLSSSSGAAQEPQRSPSEVLSKAQGTASTVFKKTQESSSEASQGQGQGQGQAAQQSPSAVLSKVRNAAAAVFMKAPQSSAETSQDTQQFPYYVLSKAQDTASAVFAKPQPSAESGQDAGQGPSAATQADQWAMIVAKQKIQQAFSVMFPKI